MAFHLFCRLLYATAGTIFFACGMFTPRESEPPLDVPRNDPLNLREILENGTSETFTKLAYEDMFNEGFRFVDSYGNIYGRSSIIARLYSIVQTYPGITTSWQPDSAVEQPPMFDRDDTVTLYRTYEVHAPELTFPVHGSAIIMVVYAEPKSTWTLLAWKDNPAMEPGFFNPLYIDLNATRP